MLHPHCHILKGSLPFAQKLGDAKSCHPNTILQFCLKLTRVCILLLLTVSVDFRKDGTRLYTGGKEEK